MPFCGNCGEESLSGKLFRANCGMPIVRAAGSGLEFDKTGGKSSTIDTSGALLGCLALVIVAAAALWWIAHDSDPTVPAPPDTRPGTYYRTTQPSFCSPSEDDARIAAKAIQANDTEAIENMIRRGRFLVLAARTRARWIWERPPGLVEVRVYSGEHAGITCFTPSGYLERSP